MKKWPQNKKQERAKEIAEYLWKQYPDPPIPLIAPNSYTFLIAVLLSAQCTDERVNKVSPALFARAKTPEAMLRIPTKEIEDIIRPCGLAPKKAQAISGLSEILVAHFNGEIPQTIEELETLPGVGHKTASVVAAQIFGIPAFPVDTHIHRLAYRWKLSTGSSVTKTEKDLKALFPEKYWNSLHLPIIFYGREYCKARGHKKQDCPLCSKFGRATLD